MKMLNHLNSGNSLSRDPVSWINEAFLNVQGGQISGTARGIVNHWICRELGITPSVEWLTANHLTHTVVTNWILLPEIARCLVVQRYKGALSQVINQELSGVVTSFMQMKFSAEKRVFLQGFKNHSFEELAALEMRSLGQHLPHKLNALLRLMFPAEGPAISVQPPIFNEFIFYMAIQHVQRFNEDY
jgi:hypothetical protein